MKYTIGKVSKLFRISSDTLRHYDKLGLLKPEVDENSGYRYYEMRHLHQLDFILRAKYLEVPLSEVKEILESEDLNQYENLLSKQQKTLEDKINHLEKLKILLSKSKKELDEVVNYKKSCKFDELKILNETINYYYLSSKEYMEDNVIMNILGDICDENFNSPSDVTLEDEVFNIYNIINKNQIIENKNNVYLLQTPRNKEPLDNYFLNKYGNIPSKKISKNYIVANYYGTENEMKEYVLSLSNYFNGNNANDILVRFKFCLHKKIDSYYYWEIIYKL